MEKLVIVGGGGFAREILTLVKRINEITSTYDVVGFVDNRPKGTLIDGFPVIGTDTEINQANMRLSMALAVGEPQMKKKIRSKYTSPLISFPTLIHPSVIIGNAETVKMGEGCIICAGSILTTNVKLGSFVTLNLMCTVGHDTTIGDYSSFMPSCNVSGEVEVEGEVYCGTGAKIINQVSIGHNSIIGAGAVVSRSIPSNCTAVGIPAKPIKFHD